jgi:type II secretion system protein L
MLELVKRDVDLDQITYYARESDATPELEGHRFERVSLGSTRPGLFDAPLIDLQQRDYQLSSAWQGLAKTWKWVALLFAALLVVGAYNKAVALQALEDELADVKQQQYALVKSHLPENASPDDNLKKMLIERMQALQANQREQGFLPLLVDFTRARSKYPGVTVSRVGYQAKRLSFDISSSKLNDIEALLETVQKQGVKAKLESLNIKPDQSSGRLVLEGGGDV